MNQQTQYQVTESHVFSYEISSATIGIYAIGLLAVVVGTIYIARWMRNAKTD